MEGDGSQESGKLGIIKKAKTAGNLEDGPSSSPSLSSLWRGKGRMPDGISCDGEVESGGEDDVELEAEEEDGSRDPLMVFGSGIMMMILTKLDARSVALARLVSRGWLAVASSDHIWAPKAGRRIFRFLLSFWWSAL